MSSRRGVMNVEGITGMTCFTYILYSPSLGKYYTGSSFNVADRVRQHRVSVSGWSSRADDWVELFSVPCETISEARKLEKSIKKRGAKRFLQDKQRGSDIVTVNMRE